LQINKTNSLWYMRCKYRMRYIGLLILVLVLSNTYAQDSYVLRGWVKGIDNQAIENVTISVLGSVETPAISDSTGMFQVNINSANEWITFQPLGEYESKTVFLNGRKNLAVYLAKEGFTSYNDFPLGEGVNLQSRNVLTAHRNITHDDMKHSSNLTIDQFFQTQVAGAFVSNTSGMPGSGTSTFLRGVNTLYTSNQPLYVVDGVPLERSSLYSSLCDGYFYSPLSTIDPFDISYMTVYKDPSYSSKYGFYGSGGVVEIQTINPDASETTIDFKYRTGITQKPDYLPQLGSSQYKILANELLYSSGTPNEEYKLQYPGLFYSPNDTVNYASYNHNTNWQDEVFQDALMQNVHFSIKGGDAIAKYGISFGYLSKSGIIKNTSYDRFNARFTGNFNIIERIKMSLNVSLTNSDYSLRESGLNTVTSPIISGLWKSPILSPYAYDDLGNQISSTGEVDELGVSNPLALSRGFAGDNNNIRFLTTAKIIGELSSKLDIIGILSVNYNAVSESFFSPSTGMSLYNNGEASNETSENNNTVNGLYSNVYLNYVNDFGSNGMHNLTALAGVKTNSITFQTDFAKARNTPSDEYTSLSTGENIYNAMGGDNINYAWMSLNAGLNYNYKYRYFVDVNVTSDASTAIGLEAATPYSFGNVPMSLFYSVGGAWRISNENFMKNISVFEDVKARVSYGTSGNDDFDILASKSHSTTDQFNVLGVSVPGTLANTKLSFETHKMLNTGLDIILKGGRHQLIVDYYNTTVDNMIVYQQLPTFIGEPVFPTNDGKVSTKGVEVSLNTRIVDYEDFTFDLGLSVGTYRTEVLEMPGDRMVLDLPGKGQIISEKGKELNAFYGYVYEGVFATTEESVASSLVNSKGSAFRAGDAKYKDISGKQGVPDGIINDYDRVNLGSPNPDLVGTVSAQLTYKNWSIRAVSTLSQGQEVFNYVRYQNEKMLDLSNQSVKVLQRWTYEGQETDIPRATWGDPLGNNDFSSRWIEDGSYFRMKELTLSYRTFKPLLFIRDLEAYVSVTNVFTLTNYVGYDPEMSYSNNPMLQGVDYGVMPQTRTFTLGVNIGL